MSTSFRSVARRDASESTAQVVEYDHVNPCALRRGRSAGPAANQPIGICERQEHRTVLGRKGNGDKLTVSIALEARSNIVFPELIARHSRTKHRRLEERLL